MYKRQHQWTDPQAAYWPIRQNSQSHQNINKQFYSWIQKINLIDINLVYREKTKILNHYLHQIELSSISFKFEPSNFLFAKSWCNQFELIWQNVDPSVKSSWRLMISTGKERSHSLNCVLLSGYLISYLPSTQSWKRSLLDF